MGHDFSDAIAALAGARADLTNDVAHARERLADIDERLVTLGLLEASLRDNVARDEARIAALGAAIERLQNPGAVPAKEEKQ